MKILVTGHKGYVGSNVYAKLGETHVMRGLEICDDFDAWMRQMREAVMWADAIVHIGAISENQSQRQDIALWNTHATYLLVREFAIHGMGRYNMPFIYFSSYHVEASQDDKTSRTAYTWSKALAEEYIRDNYSFATILRPGVMWGREDKKRPQARSVPYMLATHTIKYLFRNWTRNYVHIDDVIRAIELCLTYRLPGTFRLFDPEPWTNEMLAELIEWDEYEWKNPEEVLSHVSPHIVKPLSLPLPNWKPTVDMRKEFPRLERETNASNHSVCG